MNAVRLQATLQDLNEAHGVTAADLTADELTALVHACERVNNPYSAIHADLIDKPVYVCSGVYLWPITAGAQVWMIECVEKWWPETSSWYHWAHVYALMHAREPDAFAGLTSKAAARKAIIMTLFRFAVHSRELKVAIERAYGIDRFDVPARIDNVAVKARTDFAALVARLEVSSGIPASAWLWGRSVNALIKSYVELTQLAAASAIGASKAEMKIELDAAIENLARVCGGIVTRIERERANKETKGEE